MERKDLKSKKKMKKVPGDFRPLTRVLDECSTIGQLNAPVLLRRKWEPQSREKCSEYCTQKTSCYMTIFIKFVSILFSNSKLTFIKSRIRSENFK